jgi:transposase
MSRERVLTDEQWARIEPLMPFLDGQKSRLFRDHRQVVEGIIYRLRTGIAWRDLPASFGPWQTMWKRHQRFSIDGAWDRIHARLLAEKGRPRPREPRGSQYSAHTHFNTFAPDAAYDLRVGNSRRTITRTADLTLSLASGVMLALWCLVELTPWGLFVPMAISSVGNGLSQHPAGGRAQRSPAHCRRRFRAARVADCRTIALWRWSQSSSHPWRSPWLSASSPCVGPAGRYARLDLRGPVPRPRSDPDHLHWRIYNRDHFCSAVKTPSQFGGGASIWNCAIRRR